MLFSTRFSVHVHSGAECSNVGSGDLLSNWIQTRYDRVRRGVRVCEPIPWRVLVNLHSTFNKNVLSLKLWVFLCSVAGHSNWVNIDGSDADTPGTWMSYYGGALNYLNWDTANRQPSNENGVDCLVMRYLDNGFHDALCSLVLSSLCESKGANLLFFFLV